MSNHVRIRDRKRGGSRSENVSRFRKKRPKTFKSEESAKAYAEKNKLKNYTIVNIREDIEGAKFKVVQN